MNRFALTSFAQPQLLVGMVLLAHDTFLRILVDVAQMLIV